MQSLWETVHRFLKNLKIEAPCDPLIPFLGIYLQKIMKMFTFKDICIPMFIASLFTIAKIWKQPVSINGKVDEESVYIYAHQNFIQP